MPVDLGFGNSIVEAFNRGRQDLLARQQLQQQRESEAKRSELEQERIENEKEFQTQSLKQQKEETDAHLALAQAAADVEHAKNMAAIQTGIAQTGLVPPGFTSEPIIPTRSTEPSLGTEAPPINIPGTQTPLPNYPPQPEGLPSIPTSIEPPKAILVKSKFGNFIVPTPAEFARQQGESAMALEQPKIELEEKKQFGELNRQAILQDIKDSNAAIQEEANRKNALAVANIRAAATANARVSNRNDADIMAIKNKFDANPLSEEYRIIKEANETASQLESKIKSGAGVDDMSLVMAYVKSQNPKQAVRGELLNSAVNNYIQNLPNKLMVSYNRTMSGDTKFLTPEAEKQLITAIHAKHQLTSKAYDNLYSKTAEQIKSKGGDPNLMLFNHNAEEIEMDNQGNPVNK